MKYLIVGPSWVGDMVMAQTLFIALKRQHPEAVIDVLAPGWSRPIIERMPEVRNGIDMPVGHGSLNLAVRRRIARDLKAQGYDRTILLPNSLKSALIPFLAGIPVRIGWRGEMRYGLLNDLRVLDKEQYPLMVERFVALAYPDKSPLPSPLPKPALSVDSQSVAKALHRYQLSDDLPILALCPGAEFGPSKQWPAGYYGEVALTMAQKGWQIWLFGSEKDHAVTQEIMGYLPRNLHKRCFNLAGQTTLADAVDLMSLAHAVVSNDSGLMHIAAALSRPLVAVYGSTTAAHTPPMNDNSETLWLGLECSPCFKRECPLEHMDCMKKLGPEMVLDALERLSGEQTLEIQG
ncbi:lipopolysaccharide heptosyltransferase II [Endozoicomonas sp. ALD040]|uniref:lipopolysaccharide heptosyltransferase II n=1 Tax=unclassified Endozoicomonas TaxID=2644528 RepID=UPI003BB16988